MMLRAPRPACQAVNDPANPLRRLMLQVLWVLRVPVLPVLLVLMQVWPVLQLRVLLRGAELLLLSYLLLRYLLLSLATVGPTCHE